MPSLSLSPSNCARNLANRQLGILQTLSSQLYPFKATGPHIYSREQFQADLLSKNGKVAGGCHEKQHRYRQPGVHSRSQKRSPDQLCVLGRDGASLLRRIISPCNYPLLMRPYYAPYIQEHQSAESTTDT